MVHINTRQLRLKNSIDGDLTPLVIDATSIWNANGEVPFHWGDIEAIGYGYTNRVFDGRGEKVSVDRHYTGPGRIMLEHHGYMQRGDIAVGEK